MRTPTLTQKKHGAEALEHVALERELLTWACVFNGLSGGKYPGANGWHRMLPDIAPELYGYERQVMVAMQLGLYVLHYSKPVEKAECTHALTDASGLRCLACGELRETALRGAA